ncbi:ATP-binding cassette domain-containing protein [Neorhizobium galegae]|uniref:iron ABC transporter ATP-binding protein n=1 Tax=Neorhizobium galegae TaxID=399 RepID=UPI002104E6F9|nr:ATP-binding cassette domain-containing protein [Neorhizobium galegae]MCQ1776391.1 ATP-binding cassette domain-containing protein [Neorhizobium galegae]MCQ1798887.1 ATP-binding cassette domain-containing protein [Neorhizobium galegae]
MIRIENVSLRHGKTQILHDISLTIAKGGITALVGPNGAGKSSLLSLIARLQPLQAGRITIDGFHVDATPNRDLARILAILRQDSIFTSRLRVRELVSFGRFPHGRGRLTPADYAIIDQSLQQFDLTDLADRFIETLSGGQRQRALVAMAFAQETDYLLLDEPLNNLDMYFARELMRSLRRIADENGKTIVIVLHDINQAGAHADRIVALQSGRIVADGAPCDLLTPKTLQAIFGFEMRVETVDDTPVVLHFR